MDAVYKIVGSYCGIANLLPCLWGLGGVLLLESAVIECLQICQAV